MISVGILTVSTLGAAGQRKYVRRGDRPGATAPPLAATIDVRQLVTDDRASIEAVLRHWADDLALHVALTTGGTGLSPTDVTPEATLAVVDRLVPGLAEAMRVESLKKTPFAMLSRAVAGCRGATLIINLPGSPKGVRECLEVILPVLPTRRPAHRAQHPPRPRYATNAPGVIHPPCSTGVMILIAMMSRMRLVGRSSDLVSCCASYWADIAMESSHYLRCRVGICGI